MEHTEETIYGILLAIREAQGNTAAKLENILAQTTKTNGRVTHLEGEMDDRKEFENTWKGKIAIIGVCLGFVGTLVANWMRNRLGL